MKKKIENVAILNTPEMRYFMLDLIDRMRKNLGCNIHIYCSTKEEVRFYESRNQNGVFASINIAKTLEYISFPDEPIAFDEEIAISRSFERRIQCTYNRLLVNNRHLGRGYALGGPGHPRSRRSETTDQRQVVWAFNRIFEYWEAQIDGQKIDLILNCSNYIYLIARSKGIPFRGICGARFENYHYWSDNEFYDNPNIEKEFSALDVEPETGVQLSSSYIAEQNYRPISIQSARLVHAIRKSAMLSAKRAYHHIRGYSKARGYYLFDTIRHIFRQWYDSKIVSGKGTLKLQDIKDRAFVFYPLQTEPEASLGGFSPEYFFQHSAIASLSRDLPAGVLLAVKETIHGIGRRPRDFYRSVSDLKNTVWIDMFEPGVDVVRASRAVATITGTAGFEAAVMGIPVLSFGHHNNYNFLPHVFVIEDGRRLSHHLEDILEGRIDTDKARNDGARFLQAVVRSSFDMGNFSYVNQTSYDQSVVDRAYEALMSSLEPQGSHPYSGHVTAGD